MTETHKVFGEMINTPLAEELTISMEKAVARLYEYLSAQGHINTEILAFINAVVVGHVEDCIHHEKEMNTRTKTATTTA
jgi:SAM-dependent MidA family methyltransferase